MWYCIFFDAYGTNDLIETCDQEPSEQEQDEMSQVVGYHFGGCWQASSEAMAFRLAEKSFDGGGCVS